MYLLDKKTNVILGSPLGPSSGDHETSFSVLFQLWEPKVAKRHPGPPPKRPPGPPQASIFIDLGLTFNSVFGYFYITGRPMSKGEEPTKI